MTLELFSMILHAATGTADVLAHGSRTTESWDDGMYMYTTTKTLMRWRHKDGLSLSLPRLHVTC